MKAMRWMLHRVPDGLPAFLFFLIICFAQLPVNGQSGKAQLAGLDSLKGKLPLPVDRYCGLDIYEPGKGRDADDLNPRGYPYKYLTFYSDSSMLVKSPLFGKVLSVFVVDDKLAVFIQTEGYFFTYSNLDTAYVKKGHLLQTSQLIGKITSTNYDGLFELEVWMFENDQQIDPYPWYNFGAVKGRIRR